jgi:hypothetical protein
MRIFGVVLAANHQTQLHQQHCLRRKAHDPMIQQVMRLK